MKHEKPDGAWQWLVDPSCKQRGQCFEALEKDHKSEEPTIVDACGQMKPVNRAGVLEEPALLLEKLFPADENHNIVSYCGEHGGVCC